MSKLKAIQPKLASPSKPKILVFGKAGVGKTWTALDFPSVYYIDCEGGANLPHYTDKLARSNGVYFGIEQGSQDFATVIEQIKALATEKHEYRTVIIDSITKIFNNEIQKEAERLGDKDAFGASKKPAVAFTRKLISWVDKLDMNVILIAHEKPMWANDKQIGVTYDAYDKLEYELHLNLNITKQGETRKAIVKKTRLLGFADGSSFEWSYAKFAELYGKDIIERQSKVFEVTTPEQIAEITRLLSVVKLGDSAADKRIEDIRENLDEIDTEKAQNVITYLTKKLGV